MRGLPTEDENPGHFGRYIEKVFGLARYQGSDGRNSDRDARPLAPPAAKEGAWEKKIERAMEIRESTAKAREGKPVSFPLRRARA
jgi:hypothetical protein